MSLDAIELRPIYLYKFYDFSVQLPAIKLISGLYFPINILPTNVHCSAYILYTFSFNFMKNTLFHTPNF